MDPSEFDWYQLFKKNSTEQIFELYDYQILWDIVFDRNYDIAEADCMIDMDEENNRWSSIPGVMSELIVLTEEVVGSIEKLQLDITNEYHYNHIDAIVRITNITPLENVVEDYVLWTHKATITISFPVIQNLLQTKMTDIVR